MYIKRFLSNVMKCPKNYNCLPSECICETEFQKLLKGLNIKIVTLTMKQKEDTITDVQNDKSKKELDQIKKERCD